MTTPVPPAGSGAPTGGEPQQGIPSTPTGNQGAPTTPEPGAQGATPTPVANPEAQRYAQEAAAYRKRAQELEAQLKTAQDAQLTEQQKLQRDLQELQLQQGTWQQMQQGTNLMLGIYRLGTRLGLRQDVSAEDVAGMMAGGFAVTFDQDNQPVALEQALQQFLAARPYLLSPGAQPGAQPLGVQQPGQPPQPQVPVGTGGVGNPGRQQGQGSQAQPITEQYVASLTPDMYAALPQSTKDAIRAWQVRQQSNMWRRGR